MKRCLILACCILLSASWAFAEIGALCLYTDASGTDCNFVDNGGLVDVYIVHKYADAVSASQFRLDVSGTGWTHLGDVWEYPLVIGTSINGVSVGYGACQTSPFTLGKASFMGASAPANTMLRIVPHPSVGEILMVDCEDFTRVGAGGTAYVNSSNACVCQTNQVPELEVDPASFDFGYFDATRDLTVTNRGGGTLNWALSESINWLFLSNTSGTNRETVTLTVERSGIPSGVYTGSIQVTSNGGSTSIPVMMTVAPTEPILRVSPSSIAFSEYQETVPLYIFNDGAAGLNWSISSDQPWLTVAPASGVDGGQVSVMVDRTGLSYGTYYGNLTVTSNGGNRTVSVSVMVPPNEPVLGVSPTALNFLANEISKSLAVSNVGVGELTFEITTDQPWLTVAPSSGSTTSSTTVIVFVNPSGLSSGTYYGNVSITSNGGDATVPVSMEVPGPTLDVFPPSLTFDVNTDVLQLTVANTGGGDLNWTITPTEAWLSVDPSAGTNTQQVQVTVDRTGLGNGFYFGELAISSNGGSRNVFVALYVESPTPVLSVAPMALSFDTDSDRTVWIDNSGTGVLEWNITPNAAWLSATPSSGTDYAAVNVHVDRTGLPDGLHTSTLSITSNGGNETVSVDMWVGPRPILTVSPLMLGFSPDVTTNTFTITNTGDGTLEWALSADEAWIEIVPPLSGTNDATVTVNVDPASVPSGGVQIGHIEVSSNAGSETVQIQYVPSGPIRSGTIAVFSDAGGTSNVFSGAEGVVQVHFIHIYHDGATASQFRLNVGQTSWTYIGDNWVFPTVIGTSVTGVSVAYGGCMPAPTYLGAATFLSPGFPECREIWIEPAPDAPSGHIEVVDCLLNKLFGTGGSGYVNCDVSIPVETTTWGRIKAMYAPDEN